MCPVCVFIEASLSYSINLTLRWMFLFIQTKHILYYISANEGTMIVTMEGASAARPCYFSGRLIIASRGHKNNRARHHRCQYLPGSLSFSYVCTAFCFTVSYVHPEASGFYSSWALATLTSDFSFIHREMLNMMSNIQPTQQQSNTVLWCGNARSCISDNTFIIHWYTSQRAVLCWAGLRHVCITTGRLTTTHGETFLQNEMMLMLL